MDVKRTNIWKSTVSETFYGLRCTNCSESQEISAKEYDELKPFLKINAKFKKNEITYDEYQILNEKYIKKLGRKRHFL